MFPTFGFVFSALLMLTVMLSASSSPSVTLKVDVGSRGQIWEGWGATDGFSFQGLAVEPEAGRPGPISLEGRRAILKLYYADMGMNRVRFNPGDYEPVNDNDDPRVLNLPAFVWKGRGARPHQGLDPFCDDHLVLGAQYRSPGEPFVFYPTANQWESWMSATPDSRVWWAAEGARFNPAMVDEYAEHALAAVLHVKALYHYEIPAWSLFNEPKKGARPSKETTLALVLATGRRFKENELKTKLAICDDITPEASAQTIEYVLADPEARRYVGAVSYHRYTGDFVLEQVKPMLAKAEKGLPLVKEPVSVYASAAKYGKSVWLSEQCSYGDDGITYYDTGRARSNHICDEINNGKVNAFDFMCCYFVERGRPANEESPIFIRLKDGKYASAEINPFGQWIRHFTRGIRPGAVRLDVSLDDNMLKAVAFRDAANRTLTVVVLNNHTEPVPVSIQLEGWSRRPGKVHRIATSPGKLYRRLPEVTPQGNRIADDVPGTGIVTYQIDP